MKLYEVTYETPDGENKRAFASSDGAASKLATELKSSGKAVKKPERAAFDIETGKEGLLAWLNKNATAV